MEKILESLVAEYSFLQERMKFYENSLQEVKDLIKFYKRNAYKCPGNVKSALARAASLTPERRKEIASKAGRARWSKHKERNEVR